MYNIASNQWTFVMGSTTANQTGLYGLALSRALRTLAAQQAAG